MRNMYKIVLIAVSMMPAVLFGQLIVTSPTNSGFNGQVSDMYSAVENLFSTNNPNSGYSEIVYSTDYNPFDNSTIGSGKFITNATSPQFAPANTDLNTFNFLFVEVPNKTSFLLNSFASIGFFGNESADRNKLWLIGESVASPGTTQTIDPLFGYGNTASSTPATTDLGVVETVELTFYHTDISYALTADQTNPAKFKMFQLFDRTTDSFENSFILAIDDRMTREIDFDDGFFFLTGDVTPVPEPSVIGLMAVVGLLGFVYVRRKLVKKSK